MKCTGRDDNGLVSVVSDQGKEIIPDSVCGFFQ